MKCDDFTTFLTRNLDFGTEERVFHIWLEMRFAASIMVA